MDHQLSLNSEPSDEYVTILADPYCRAVLTYFRDAPSEVATVESLADEIPKQDHGGSPPTAAQLHHLTLPRLDDAGAVEYDGRSNTARYRGYSKLETLLDTLTDR